MRRPGVAVLVPQNRLRGQLVLLNHGMANLYSLLSGGAQYVCVCVYVRSGVSAHVHICDAIVVPYEMEPFH